MSKPPVVLVHGMGSSFEHNWRRHGWVDLLEADGRHVLAFDMPGHGKAPKLEGEEDSGVQRLVDLVSEHGVVDIVGFSAGSVLSLTAVLRHPELFGKVALMGISDAQLRATQELRAQSIGDGTSDAMRGVRLAAERAGNDFESVLDWARRGDEPPAFVELAGCDKPVLFVQGDKDFLGLPDRLVTELPNARLVTIRDTDHFTTTSRFEAQLAVTEFLAS